MDAFVDSSGVWHDQPSTGTLGVDQANALNAMTQGTAAKGVVNVPDGASIPIDLSQGSIFATTLGGNRTLAAPVNATDGREFWVRVTQDGTGSRTLSLAAYDLGAAGAPTLSTAAGKIDLLKFQYVAAAGKACLVGSWLGF